MFFYSYAHEDEKLLRRLEKHLTLLRRQGLISDWQDYKIVAGSERTESVNSHLESASLILLLISPDFMASDYCYSVEMQRALERHRAGLSVVIPILLRPVDWQATPFASLQFLPRNGLPVVRWSDRDAALLAIVKGIREAVETITHSEGISSRQSVARQPVQDQNRQRFLKRVRTTWITDLLEHSLFNATLMELDLHDLSDATTSPWHLLVQETQQAPRPLPAGTHIIEVYDEADGELLILGEPGAGKTTLLLELARSLLTRAEYNADHPLPAIFTLSSWAEKRQPLTEWLIEELHERYRVPRKLGTEWITSNQLLLLLDGLDEVASPHQASCIDAINHYQQEHSIVPLVVCSRHTEYMAQPIPLVLQRSVIVQPLTLQQIDAYLSSIGEQVAAVRTAILQDAELQELATTPLMLNVLTLTYQGKTPDELTAIKSPELLRRQLFTQYVARMLQRRRIATHYGSQQTCAWLVNLARQMKQHGQTVFYIERMQMDWLARSSLIRYFRIGVVLICGLIGMLIGLLTTWLTVKPLTIQAVLVGGGGIALAIGLLGGLQLKIRPSETFIWSWRIMIRRWFNVLLLMILCALVGGLGVDQIKNVLVSTLIGGLFGVLFSLIFNVLLEGEADSISDTRHISIPNQEIKRSARYSLLIIAISVPFILLFIPLSKLEVILVATFSLTGALGFGGLACIQHFVLRFLLWRSGQLPWNLPRFLDYAAERILLRKVGGGYIFIHRLLLDYFASLDEDELS
ncbi:MAG: TIR domain-containing protein [Ktedonobacteraceae bacterium]|nr:TIR domain-containing protein [Ktedonobacteraceae bacterium]